MIEAPKDLDNLMSRLLDASENAALELEKIRILKEFELGVRIEIGPDGNPHVEEGSA
jgi:hypothetical protein